MMIDEYRNGFHIRSIRPIDKEPFMELRRSVSIIGEAYNEIPEFLEWDWIRFLEGTDDHYMAVFDNDDTRFVASCSFQNIIDSETGEESSFIEIGLDVVAELQEQGIGTCLMHELIDIGHKQFPDKDLYICIREDNDKSIHVAEKNGGKLIGRKMTPEAVIIKKALDESDTWDVKPEEREIKYMQEAIRRGTDAVLIYKV